MKPFRLYITSFAALLIILFFHVGKNDANSTEPGAIPRGILPPAPHFSVMYDTAGTMTLNDVLKRGVFSPLEGDTIRMIPEKRIVWLRFRMPGNTGITDAAENGQLLLEISPSFPLLLDRINFYTPATPGTTGPAHAGYHESIGGAKYRTAPAGIHSKNFIFPVPGGLSGRDDLYLRLESTMDVQVWLALVTQNELRKKDLVYIASYGIMYGILLSMVLYNAFIFFVLRDRNYVFYVLYVLAGLTWQMSVHGHLRYFMEPPPELYWPMLWCSVGLFILLGAFVVGTFLNVRKFLPRMRYLFIATGALGILTVIAGLGDFNRAAFSISHTGGLVLPALCAAACIVRIRQGFRSAVLFLSAWLLLIAGGLVFTLMGLQILPVSFFTVNAIAVGITAEAVLLSLALANRIAELRREKEALKRTQFRYRELSITDELTGLYNRRFMMERLQGEIERTRRTSEILSLAIMDLDNFKTVNDTHGHMAGDEVLKEVAHSLVTNVRSIDTLCRFGGDEFLMLMPSTTLDSAEKVAERIRLAVKTISSNAAGDADFTMTTSIGIAQMHSNENSTSLLERADRALYEAKHAGKDRVVCDR